MRSALWPVCRPLHIVPGILEFSKSSWVPRICVCNGYVTHEAAKSNLGCVVEFDLSLADGGVTSAVSKGNLGKGSCCYPLEYRRPQ